MQNQKIDFFLSQYDESVYAHALQLREIVLANFPGVIEQLDVPAKMVAYCYGQKYSELICVIIPSKKGLKLGFNQGSKLPDPSGLLQGTGKISRYVEISGKDIKSAALKKLLANALKAYKDRMKEKK
jgi:hypothetical protein